MALILQAAVHHVVIISLLLPLPRYSGSNNAVFVANKLSITLNDKYKRHRQN